MKKVVSPEQVAHLFANKLQDEARTSAHNFSFNVNNLYSYSTIIAKHVKNEQENSAMLLTLKRYSNTTSKQISIIRSASNHLNVIYCGSPTYTHDENFNYWLIECESIARNLKKAKKPEIYLNSIASVNTLVNRYASFFGVQIPIELQTLLSVSNSEEFTKYTETKEALRLETEKKKQAELKKELSKQLKEWRKFKKSRLYIRNGFDYLRYNSIKNRLETSQNIEIPLDVAKRAYTWLKTVLNSGCVNCNFKILDFEVKEVTKKHIVIGCHKIEIKEINKFSNILN